MLKKLGERIFKFYCHPDYQEDILGDMEEYYEQNCTEKGRRRAGFKFFIDSLLLFRLSLLKEKLSYHKIIYAAMVQNIIKTAFRVFWRERGYSLMNILGLTVGIAASMLLFLYIQSEKSVNQFHEDIDQLYQVMLRQTYPGGVEVFEDNPGPLVTTFKDDMPELESMAAFTWPEALLFLHDDVGYKETGRFASEDFLHIFDVTFIEGQKSNSLSSPSEVFLSKSLKEKIFGADKALGQTVEVNGWGQFQVGGVFEDVPNNSTIKFDFLLPYERWSSLNPWVEDWGNSGILGIAKLSKDTDYQTFNNKIENYVASKMPDGESINSIFLQPFKDRYLYNRFENGKQAGGRITYVNMFMAVSFFILLIAVINFMNLATARSAKRAKEVGVKKVVGSTRLQLQFQFMMESLILALVSTILAGVLIMMVIDPLNSLVGKEMSFSWLDIDKSISLLGLGAGVGILAGIYPSFVLSDFKVLSVLKGSFKNTKWSSNLRKGLVVFQFAISTCLIISTLIIRSQMDYIMSMNLGYEKEHLLLLPVEGEITDLSTREQLKNSILSNPSFTSLTFSSGTPISIESSTSAGFSWEGKVGEFDNDFNIVRTDTEFIDTYGMEIIEGRNFDINLATDTMNVIINEQTAKVMNLEDPLNVPIRFWGRNGRVVGIVKDFHYNSVHEEIQPMVISWRPRYSTRITLKMAGQNIPESLEFLENVITDLNPNYPFQYSFVNDSYERLYKSESTIGILTNYFSGIAIFISLLGLFGLSSYAAEQRIKEIGVRKVLGANSGNLIILMSKGFLLLAGLGFLVAVPIGYSFMNNWLESFEYKIQIGAPIFLVAAGISLFITVLTVSYHSMKAAYSNPVKNLRYE